MTSESMVSTGNSARLADALSEIVRQRAAGVTVDFDALRERYGDIWAKLESRLSLLDRVRSAAMEASRSLDPIELSDESSCNPEILDLVRRNLKGYTILHPISSGGQAHVLKARQHSTRRMVALKIFENAGTSARRKARFARELELVAQLNHPNIVTVFEGGEADGYHYYAMEYIDGLSLKDYVLMEPPLKVMADMFVQICRGLSYAHQRGIIHRDLKPANIMVSESAVPRILDFGLAKQLVEDAVSEGISLPNQVVGTPQYFSPEQFGGQDGYIDVRSDIYSLGVVFYEVLTGGFPYETQGGLDKLRECVLTAEAASLKMPVHSREGPNYSRDELRGDLDAVIRKALRKEKEHRYQSAADFGQDIERYTRGEAVHAKSGSRIYQIRKSLRKHRIAASIGGIVLVSFLGVANAWRREANVSRWAQQALDMGAMYRSSTILRDKGRVDSAISMLEGAVAIGESERFKTPEIMRMLYGAYFVLAQLTATELKQPEEAWRHAERAEYYSNQLAKKSPNDPVVLADRAHLHILRAQIADTLEQWQTVYDQANQAVLIRSELEKTNPDDPRQHADTAFAMRYRGRSLRYLSRIPEALADYFQVRAVYQALHDDDPSTIEYPLELARTDSMIVECLILRKTAEDDDAARERARIAVASLGNLQSDPRSEPQLREIDSTLASLRKHLKLIERRIAKRSTQLTQIGSSLPGSVPTGTSSPSSGSSELSCTQ